MSRQKPGRNEPCPCGSGKKYKACHAAEDRLRESAAPAPRAGHPLADELQKAMALLRGEDLEGVSRTLEHLGGLLTQWGPVPGLRFDAALFHTHVSRQLDRMEEAVERDPAQARNALRLSTVRELGTRAFLDKLRATLLARATAAGLSAEDRQALCLGALLASTPKDGRVRPEDRPVLDVVFSAQFREWGARHGQALAASVDTGDAALSDEAREALRQAGEGDMDALVKYVESDPGLAQRIAQEAKERAGRVEAAMRQPTTPSLLAPEEQVWLTSVLWAPLTALKDPALDAPARSAAVSGFLGAMKRALADDPDFQTHLLERLRTRAQDPALDEATRGFFTDAAVAVQAEPVRMVLAAVLTARGEPEARSAEEQVVRADLEAKSEWTADDLEPYRALLADMKLPASVERIQRAQAWLRAHPIAQTPAP
ncbi:SEC-C metal-binding domain-containing protein [Archangium primigenium]|uniref:SEC-C metal-binding domain-containing protein n=1 Tax=[Archangium] primigenium TaxID=2792470 RepID=UPI00195CFEE8|nr:SEC-C domain-containing protein [Archangium primigenium]